MITFTADNTRFKFRIVGIALHGDRVLLHRLETDDYWSLPGGTGELLEPAADTLRREMLEEMGESVNVDWLVCVVENFFDHEGMRHHELA
ncbi:MAG: NUDIX domain-containing protein, partial [Chloroflexi bacterium]|nr:NUDIX domain-containing protein [Chloroflexota bacterium]